MCVCVCVCVYRRILNLRFKSSCNFLYHRHESSYQIQSQYQQRTSRTPLTTDHPYSAIFTSCDPVCYSQGQDSNWNQPLNSRQADGIRVTPKLTDWLVRMLAVEVKDPVAFSSPVHTFQCDISHHIWYSKLSWLGG